MSETRAQPSLVLPIQARSVLRGPGVGWDRGGPAGDPGVSAAANLCRDLTGLAQQMCYALLYGV